MENSRKLLVETVELLEDISRRARRVLGDSDGEEAPVEQVTPDGTPVKNLFNSLEYDELLALEEALKIARDRLLLSWLTRDACLRALAQVRKEISDRRDGDVVKTKLGKLLSWLADAKRATFVLQRSDAWKTPGGRRDELVSAIEESVDAARRTLLSLNLPQDPESEE